MRKSIAILILLVITYLYSFAQSNDIDPKNKSIENAQTAYFQMDHATAYSIFTNIWKDKNQNIEDRTTAGRMIAKMDWLFYENTIKAFETIDALQKINHDLSGLYITKARILADQSKFDAAIAASQKAIDLSNSKTEKLNALLSFSKHVLGKNKHQLLINKSHEIDLFKNNTELKKGYAIIQKLAKDKLGDVDVSKLYLGYSLLLKRGQEAFDGWMSYYRYTNINQVHKSLIGSVDLFKNALFKYQQSTKDELIIKTIIRGLAESGFYEYAALLIKIHYGTQPNLDSEINEIVLYHTFLTDINKINKEFYIQTIKRKKDKDSYLNALAKKARTLWDQLTWNNSEKPKFSLKQFDKEMNKRFKVVLKLMSANGYYGMHMGHIVLDDRKVISQYNESANFRYISIDHMVSNGYSGWFWDGLAETGGWARKDKSFLQVRSAYTSGPIKSWQRITDSLEVLKTEKKIKNLLSVDDSLARANPYSFLPGLSLRINYQETKKLLDSLVKLGLEGSKLRLKFISSIERIKQGSSIYAHEGRHAIDLKNNYSGKSKKLEYTAKLSEIYFSEKPMLSFTAIMSRNIGDETSHGKANLKVIKGLVAWMKKNKKKIAEFDNRRPLLPQIDKLTDKQLKVAIRSMDPIAK